MAVLFDCLDFYGLCASYSSYSFYSKNDIDGKRAKGKRAKGKNERLQQTCKRKTP